MKKLLVVIDMQNDYLNEPRMDKFNYDTNSLVEETNKAIDTFAKNNDDVVYVRHYILNLWTNRKLIGFSIKGTPGAEIYDGINIKSKYIFNKYVGDTFSNKEFDKCIRDGGYESITLCGIDMCGCVQATAKGGLKRGYNVNIIDAATGCRFGEAKRNKKQAELIKRGVSFI